LFWHKVKSRFSGAGSGNISGSGLVIFNVVEDAIKAEKVLEGAGYACKLVAPPPALRKGCDLALEINLVEQPVIERVLDPEVPYVDISPLAGTAELLQIVKVSEYGKYTMVKAGNMKVTFDNTTGVIVNTSGGGCPDIPYLHLQLVGQKLTDAPHPKDLGFTLCSLMLDRAFEECLSLWERGKSICCS